jgi:hypothetical protein
MPMLTAPFQKTKFHNSKRFSSILCGHFFQGLFDIRFILRSSEDLSRHSLTALLGDGELRPFAPNLSQLPLFQLLPRVSDPLPKSCSIQHRRQHGETSPHVVSLEERIVKARSSMALQTYLMSFSIRTNPHKMEENQLVILVFVDKYWHRYFL